MDNTKTSSYSLEELNLMHAVKRRRSAAADSKDAVKIRDKEEGRLLGEEETREEDDDDDDDEDHEQEASRRCFAHGYHLVKGKMGHGMEDYIVADTRTIDGKNLGLYAIFDGHSGRDVADYLQSHLFDNILSQPDFWRNPRKAIERAYKSTDDHILENVVGSRGGSTAVTAILVDGKKLVVANVGDSRAVLCKKGRVKQVTVDHEPEKERDKVESKGGFVSTKPGNVPRVDGQLAMARAFGDGSLKQHISVKPDVKTEEIDDDEEFLILASDGLWKVMSNEGASEHIKGISNPEEAAKKLIQESLDRGSKDDISCVVVSFH